jgi:hypothetical protein
VVELYDLQDDPREGNELSGERPDKVAELEASWRRPVPAAPPRTPPPTRTASR